MNTRDKIYSYLKRHPNATVREIREKFNISSTSVVQHHIERLREAKLIVSPPPKSILRAYKRKDLLIESLKELQQELKKALKEIDTYEDYNG